MIRISQIKPLDVVLMLVAVFIGSIIIYFCERMLNIKLAAFYGISTFNPVWILALIAVPLIAGIAVSLIYGLGGKIIAHFSPIPVQIFQYLSLKEQALPEGVSLLPFEYWVLILIVCVEACAVGGFIGEVIIKKTYGRRPKHLIHKRYQVKDVEKSKN